MQRKYVNLYNDLGNRVQTPYNNGNMIYKPIWFKGGTESYTSGLLKQVAFVRETRPVVCGLSRCAGGSCLLRLPWKGQFSLRRCSSIQCPVLMDSPWLQVRSWSDNLKVTRVTGLVGSSRSSMCMVVVGGPESSVSATGLDALLAASIDVSKVLEGLSLLWLCTSIYTLWVIYIGTDWLKFLLWRITTTPLLVRRRLISVFFIRHNFTLDVFVWIILFPMWGLITCVLITRHTRYFVGLEKDLFNICSITICAVTNMIVYWIQLY